MAIYHLAAKTVSRGGSASAAARSDYIDRSGRYRDEAFAEVIKGIDMALERSRGLAR